MIAHVRTLISLRVQVIRLWCKDRGQKAGIQRLCDTLLRARSGVAGHEAPMMGDEFLPSPDLLSEQSYLVARAVRPLALVGHCSAEPDVLLRVATRVEDGAGPNVVPFVLDHGDGTASYGYAGASWALDLYAWAVQDEDVPQEQRERIIGLLLGYGVAAISRYEDEGSGRRFPGEVDGGGGGGPRKSEESRFL